MSNIYVERIRDSAGDNVIVCREKDHKPKCYWFKYGNTEQLAMVLGAMDIFDCNTVREIAQKAGVVEDFVAKYCDSKPHPELYGMRSEVMMSE